jgi:hypothetical protein
LHRATVVSETTVARLGNVVKVRVQGLPGLDRAE